MFSWFDDSFFIICSMALAILIYVVYVVYLICQRRKFDRFQKRLVLKFLQAAHFNLDDVYRPKRLIDRIRFSMHHSELYADSTSVGNSIIRGPSDAAFNLHDELQKEIDQLKIGKILFNPPNIMKVGVKERIEVRVTQDLEVELNKALRGRGIPQIEKIRIYEIMKLKLSGGDFNIVSLSEEEQIVSKKGITEWAWDVTPGIRGKQVLQLMVTLQIKIESSQNHISHPVLEREITVEVNPVYSTKVFLIENWKWVVTALVMPIALVFLAHYLELLPTP